MNGTTEEAQAALRRHVLLDRYAEILAAVLHFGTDRTAEVVARFGLSVEHWVAVDLAWSEELAQGMRRRERGQALRFSSNFQAKRRILRLQLPQLADVGDPASPTKTAAPSEKRVPAEEPQVLPSFMRAPAAPAQPTPIAAPVAARPPPPATPAARPKPNLGGTMLALDPRVSSPTPFKEARPAAAASAAAVVHAQAIQGPRAAAPAPGGTEIANDRLGAIARSFAAPGAPPAPLPLKRHQHLRRLLPRLRLPRLRRPLRRAPRRRIRQRSRASSRPAPTARMWRR